MKDSADDPDAVARLAAAIVVLLDLDDPAETIAALTVALIVIVSRLFEPDHQADGLDMLAGLVRAGLKTLGD